MYNPRQPEVGPARFLGCQSNGVAGLELLRSREKLFVRLADVKWRRYGLYVSAPVQVVSECSTEGRILERISSEERALWSYRVETDSDILEVEETHLVPKRAESNAPQDQLTANAWGEPAVFATRWAALQAIANWYSSTDGIPAFLGGRVRPLGHQLYAARRVLWDRVPRFILADEVGLGKTIEAGLVAQALLSADPNLRVLIIAPGSMTRQWLCEMYLRFGARPFVHVDQTRARQAGGPDLLRLLHSQRLIVSTTALESYPSLGKVLAAQKWGLVIVDEAHHHSPDTPIFGTLQQLSENSYGFLVLSATPSKRELRSLLGLLSLVAPNIYEVDQLEMFEARFRTQEEIWRKLDYTRSYIQKSIDESDTLEAEDLEFLCDEWRGLLDSDPIVAGFLEQMGHGETQAADRLVAYVQEYHRLDHRLIRTRRATVSSDQCPFSARTLCVLNYEPDTAEEVLIDHFDTRMPEAGEAAGQALCITYRRLASTNPAMLVAALEQRLKHLQSSKPPKTMDALAADPGPADDATLMELILTKTPPLPGERMWLRNALGLATEWREAVQTCARHRAALEWIVAHLRENQRNKVLVFSQEQPVVQEFADVLAAKLGDEAVERFFEALPEERLAAASLRFQRRAQCRVLVSDELGGEGRNFQMASAVMHLDTPCSVARLEQRIGRLDRAGRDPEMPVLSVVLQGPSEAERAVIATHRDVFAVYERSVGGLEFALPRLQRQLLTAFAGGVADLERVRASLRAGVQEVLAETDSAFENAIVATRPQLERANQLAELLEETSSTEEMCSALARWAQYMHISCGKQEGGAYRYSWHWENLKRPTRALSADGRMQSIGKHDCIGTYSRVVALEDESLQFFGPGHRLIDVIVHDLQSAEGRTTVIARNLGEQHRGQLFAVVLGRCTLNESGISPGLLTRARRYLWPEPLVELFGLETQPPKATRVEDETLRATLLNPGLYQGARLIQPEKLEKAIDVRLLWEALGQALPQALQRLQEARLEIRAGASSNLADHMREEMEFLRWQMTSSDGSLADFARQEWEARRGLLERVQREQIEIEGIAIIVGTDKN